MDNVREELKVELSKLGPRGRGRAYPKGLLEKLLSYTVARRRQGATLVAIVGCTPELKGNSDGLQSGLIERKTERRRGNGSSPNTAIANPAAGPNRSAESHVDPGAFQRRAQVVHGIVVAIAFDRAQVGNPARHHQRREPAV